MPTTPASACPSMSGGGIFGRRVLAQTDAVMVRELRRLGGLLKHIHNETQGRYSRDTAEALHSIKAYIEALSRDRQKG